jgi:hypothetical protein
LGFEDGPYFTDTALILAAPKFVPVKTISSDPPVERPSAPVTAVILGGKNDVVTFVALATS